MAMNPLTQIPLAFGLPHGAEWAIILLFVFILFGAKKIPELMRSLGRAQGEYQHARKQFESELKNEEAKPTAAVATPAPATTYSPETDLEKARQKAQGLGIDTEGKDLGTLNKEIAEKSGGPTS